MLAYLEKNFRKDGRNALANIIEGVRRTLGKDIPFPSREQFPSFLELKQTVTEYQKNPNSPELLTKLMRNFWAEADEKSGKTTLVPEFPLKSKEIENRAIQNQMAIFNGKDWVWIEQSVSAPNLNTTESLLRENAKKERKQIMSLETYRIGGKIHKLLSGKYFDEGITWSRVLNANGKIVCVYFTSDGDFKVDPPLDPESHEKNLGGRFEEVIKA